MNILKHACEDCRGKPVIINYKGPLLPPDNKSAVLCHECMSRRVRDDMVGLPPRPLGFFKITEEN